MWIKGFFVTTDVGQTVVADRDCVLRFIRSYPVFGGRTASGTADDPCAFFSFSPNGQQLNDPFSNTGIELNIPVKKGETYYVYSYNSASTLNGLSIQLYFDDLPAEMP